MENKEKNHHHENTHQNHGHKKDAEHAEVKNETQAEAPKQDDIEAKHKEVNDKYTRLYAEYDNFRKRTAREKIDWIKSAGEETLLKILPIMDDMERAIAHNKEISDPELLKQGLDLIFQKFKNILNNIGIEALDAKGKDFDPDLHDAITSTPAEGMKGKVVEEVEKGYKLNGKVIRHSKVIVGA
jgi:molecular chaperone GrpE